MSIKHSFISRTTLGEMSREEMREWAIKRKITTRPQIRGMRKEELLAHIVNRPKFADFEVDEEFEDLIPVGGPPRRLTKADKKVIDRMGVEEDERKELARLRDADVARKERRRQKARERRRNKPRQTREERNAQFDKIFGVSMLEMAKRRKLP